MQDLASQKFSGSDTPNTLSWRGRPPPAPNTQPGLWPGAGPKVLGHPNRGPPQLFSRGCAPASTSPTRIRWPGKSATTQAQPH